MDKEDVVNTHTYIHTRTCTQNGMLFSHGKEGNPAICDYMGGTRGHFAKWNKSKNDIHWMVLFIRVI